MTALIILYKNIRNNTMYLCDGGHLRVSLGVVADVAKANLRFLCVIWATATTGGK